MPNVVRQDIETQVPDPTDSYERSHPEHESGQGRLDNNTKATPTKRPDKMPTTVGNAQDGSKQINAHEDAKQGVAETAAENHAKK